MRKKKRAEILRTDLLGENTKRTIRRNKVKLEHGEPKKYILSFIFYQRTQSQDTIRILNFSADTMRIISQARPANPPLHTYKNFTSKMNQIKKMNIEPPKIGHTPNLQSIPRRACAPKQLPIAYLSRSHHCHRQSGAKLPTARWCNAS